jgi:NADPH-dependent 2,4-dienoyl-CoA reductase/sulfur reductase-like enzyme
LVQVSIGVKPLTDIFKGSKLSMERNGAIVVDKFQRTNIPNVFAAGDCCVAFHNLKNKNVYMPLAPIANKQGRVAGEVIANTPTKGFPGIIGTAIFKCLDIHCALTGLKTEEAKELGYDPDEITIENREIPHYYPNSKNMFIKLIFDKKSHKLLGSEIIAGSPMGAKKIDVLVAAISGSFTVEMLQDLDLAYAPPFSPVWDPILIAANVASKKSKNS